MLTTRHRSEPGGFALLVVVFFTGLSLVVLSSVLSWISTSASISDRSNKYLGSSGAAEAAIEKVCAAVSQDFQNGGITTVNANLSSYRYLTPDAADNPDWASYTFEGGATPLSVTLLTSWQFSDLNVRYRGLRGYNAAYRIVARASQPDVINSQVLGTIRRDLVLASIPVCSYSIFYGMDMEICPSTSLTLTGIIHGNGTNYLQPDSSLTFKSHFTSARAIVHGCHPDDPVFRTPGSISYQGERDAGLVSLNFPIGTNNSPDALRQLVEIPPSLESVSSPLGSFRCYNRSDLIILIGDTNVVSTSGAYNNFATSIPWTNISRFVATNLSFFNMRESRTVVVTEIDVTKLRTEYATLNSLLGRSLRSIYVADRRSQTSLTQPGVRLINGQTITSNGLTIATPHPLYVKGHYNAYSSHVNTTNTTRALPAALIADAITVLSANWLDYEGGYDLAFRRAASTTVNAAMITGIVPTGGGYYSGGYENSIRLLEDWAGRTLTFNGSMAVLYYSQHATAPWGASSDVYDTPTRRWNFDLNFLTESKLPPSIPELRVMFRGEWAILSAGASL